MKDWESKRGRKRALLAIRGVARWLKGVKTDGEV